jgi:F-type H+-transporting ATPase subunit gamma
MPNSRDLLNRRKSVKNTMKITRTMELVASSKARKAQEAAEASQPYAEGLVRIVSRLSAAAGGSDGAPHPLMEKREVKKAVLLVNCSDRGLCGAFNTNVLKEAASRIQALQDDGVSTEVITLGKKGYSSLRFMGYEPSEGMSGIMDRPRYQQAQEILEPLIERFLSGDIDHVEVIYPRFVSASRQEPSSLTLLPAGGVDADEAAADDAAAEGDINLDYKYYPDAASLLEFIIPQTVKTSFFSTLLQTSAGEHNARRVAMKNATDAASDLLKFINRSYNRARQTKITQEIAEIVGAVEAMS